jgi:hypothetical protein
MLDILSKKKKTFSDLVPLYIISCVSSYSVQQFCILEYTSRLRGPLSWLLRILNDLEIGDIVVGGCVSKVRKYWITGVSDSTYFQLGQVNQKNRASGSR